MLAKFSDGKFSLGGLFDGLKVNTNNYKETIAQFKKLDLSLPEFINDGTTNWDRIAQSIEGCDETALSYFKTLDNGNGTINNQTASVKGLSEYLKKTGQSYSFAAVKATLLNTALNAVIMFAISAAIRKIVEKINSLAHSAEYCKMRANELISSYQSALDKAGSNAKTVENLASRYESLSKGVNSLGQNVSLAADEYAEYNDIINQIADMFPALVQGYTSEGNAILSLKGNVELLRDAYKDARQEAYRMLNNLTDGLSPLGAIGLSGAGIGIAAFVKNFA